MAPAGKKGKVTASGPNSVLLLVILAFYCEASVGVKLSVALFCHLFSLRFTAQGQCSTCVFFVDIVGAGTHLKPRKKVESYRNHCVFMDARRDSSLLVTPISPPEQNPRWSHKKLTNTRARPVLEEIASLAEARITGAMIIKEFRLHRIPPLQAHSRPLW
ncbi:hypothetical protein D1007_17474 [Hordeum vulgare]|nr:hypothetical protein D1007_17474 [Hordeum vulgare]